MSEDLLEEKIDEFCRKVCDISKAEYCYNYCPFRGYCDNGANGFEKFMKKGSEENEL